MTAPIDPDGVYTIPQACGLLDVPAEWFDEQAKAGLPIREFHRLRIIQGDELLAFMRKHRVVDTDAA